MAKTSSKDYFQIVFATLATLALVAFFLLAGYGFLGAIADIFTGKF